MALGEFSALCHYLATHDVVAAALISAFVLAGANVVAILKILDDRANRREARAQAARAEAVAEEERKRLETEAAQKATEATAAGILAITNDEYRRVSQDRDRSELALAALRKDFAACETECRTLKAEIDRRDGKWRFWGLEADGGFDLFAQLMTEKRGRRGGQGE